MSMYRVELGATRCATLISFKYRYGSFCARLSKDIVMLFANWLGACIPFVSVQGYLHQDTGKLNAIVAIKTILIYFQD